MSCVDKFDKATQQFINTRGTLRVLLMNGQVVAFKNGYWSRVLFENGFLTVLYRTETVLKAPQENVACYWIDRGVVNE